MGEFEVWLVVTYCCAASVHEDRNSPLALHVR